MFYAEVNRYGLGHETTVRQYGRTIPVSAGDLYRFGTSEDRDKFVSDARFPAEAIDATEARRRFVTGPLNLAIWNEYGPGCEKFCGPCAGYCYG